MTVILRNDDIENNAWRCEMLLCVPYPCQPPPTPLPPWRSQVMNIKTVALATENSTSPTLKLKICQQTSRNNNFNYSLGWWTIEQIYHFIHTCVYHIKMEGQYIMNNWIYYIILICTRIIATLRMIKLIQLWLFYILCTSNLVCLWGRNTQIYYSILAEWINII